MIRFKINNQIEKIVERCEKYIPQNNVADSDYGSEENYTLLEK